MWNCKRLLSALWFLSLPLPSSWVCDLMQTFIEHTDFHWRVLRTEGHLARCVLFQVERQEDTEHSWHVEGVHACARDSEPGWNATSVAYSQSSSSSDTFTVASSSLVGRLFAQEQEGCWLNCLHASTEWRNTWLHLSAWHVSILVPELLQNAVWVLSSTGFLEEQALWVARI